MNREWARGNTNPDAKNLQTFVSIGVYSWFLKETGCRIQKGSSRELHRNLMNGVAALNFSVAS